jgi:hypothetical protein
MISRSSLPLLCDVAPTQKKYERKLLQALPKEDDLVHSLPCSLEELYNGRVRKMKITRHIVCTMCGGYVSALLLRGILSRARLARAITLVILFDTCLMAVSFLPVLVA